jgi:hypothetical protein
MQKKQQLIVCGMMVCAMLPRAVRAADFAEVNGLVVIEAESAQMDGDWEIKTGPLSNYTGDGYIEAGSNGTLTYTIAFANTGTYHFQWRSAAPHNTEHNDSFIRMTGPSLDIKSGGGSPCKTGDWLKVFNNAGGDKWAWQTKNCDHTSKQITVDINQTGEYTLEVKQRSTRHKIDRIILNDESKVSDSQARNLDNEETLSDGSVTPPPDPVTPTELIAPESGADIVMGATITLTGQGENLSWAYDANSDKQGEIAIGSGEQVEFTVPTDVTSPREITIMLRGDGGTVERTYQLIVADPSDARVVSPIHAVSRPANSMLYTLDGRRIGRQSSRSRTQPPAAGAYITATPHAGTRIRLYR